MNWSTFFGILFGDHGTVSRTPEEAPIQIQFLDPDMGGGWRNNGGAISNPSSITEKMRQVQGMRAGRRVRAINSLTGSVIDILT